MFGRATITLGIGPHFSVFDFGKWIACLKPRLLMPKVLEMWANARRDGRPAEYGWLRMFNTAKFYRRPLLQCRAVTLPRRETR